MITPRIVPDDRLLRRYVADGDEEAFAELLERHEGLVRGVCRQVLGPGGDIDDAAQSAFVSLARHAPRLLERMQRGGSLGSWMYRVAVNAALQQRRASRSRKRRERRVVRRTPREWDETARHVEAHETLAILDQEVRGLPRRFRRPLVLCHLEGKTQHEAAKELGLSYGTLRRRLDQARHLLRARLDRRGVMASAGLLVLLDMLSAEAAAGATVIDGVNGAAGHSVTYVAPKVASTPHGGVSSSMVWSCVSKPVSLAASYWLVGAVIAGLMLPPAISIVAPTAWATTAEQGRQPSPSAAPADRIASPGQLASTR